MTADLSAGAVSVDGVITPPADARISVMDHGFLFGDSVYEVVRTWKGRPVGWAEHLQRLRGSAASIYLEIPWSDDELRVRVRETVAATGLPDAYMRMIVSRGVGPLSLLPDGCDSPSLLVFALPLPWATIERQKQGIPLVIPDRLRNDERALSPSAKTGNYLNNLLALVEARKQGGQDAVLVNAAGHVTEATTANVFWVRGGEVYTPSLDCGILAGITRDQLIPALRSQGIVTHEGRFPVEDLRRADEVFLTGTIRAVSPVVTIDGKPVGDGEPGPVTGRIMALNESVMEANSTDW